MKHNERDNNGSSMKKEAAKPATLPTKNSPAGAQATGPKGGGDFKPNQAEVAGKGKDTPMVNANKGGSTVKAAADKPWSDANKR